MTTTRLSNELWLIDNDRKLVEFWRLEWLPYLVSVLAVFVSVTASSRCIAAATTGMLPRCVIAAATTGLPRRVIAAAATDTLVCRYSYGYHSRFSSRI